RQNRFNAVKRYDRGRSLIPRYDSGDHRADFRAEFTEERIAFSFADFLDDDLLGGLRSDAAANFGLVHWLRVVRARDFARFTIDDDDNIRQLTVVLLCSRDERRFDGLEDDLLVNALLSMERIDDAEHVSRIHDQALWARFLDLILGF